MYEDARVQPRFLCGKCVTREKNAKVFFFHSQTFGKKKIKNKPHTDAKCNLFYSCSALARRRRKIYISSHFNLASGSATL